VAARQAAESARLAEAEIALPLQQSLMRTARERAELERTVSELTVRAISNQAREAGLAEDALERLTSLASRVTLPTGADLVRQESVRLMEQATLTIDEQRASITGWAAEERERLALLVEDNRLTEEQAALIDTKISRVEEDRAATLSSARALVTAQSAQATLAQGLQTFMTTTGSASDRFRAFAAVVVQELTRIIAQMAAANLLGLFSFGGNAATGAFGASGVPFAPAGAGAVGPPAPGGITGFAMGGVAGGTVQRITPLHGQQAASARAAGLHATTGAPIRAFAAGGIVRGPTAAIMGEGRASAEAFVPLPDGRRIEAVIQDKRGGGVGGGGEGGNFNFNISINAIDSKSFRQRLHEDAKLIVDEISVALVRDTAFKNHFKGVLGVSA